MYHDLFDNIGDAMTQDRKPNFTQADINVAIMEGAVPMTETQNRGEFCRSRRTENNEYVYEDCTKAEQVFGCARCNPSRKS